MTKEEIWSKTRHFKIESNIGKLDLIDTDVYLDLLNKYDDLQHQLKEKDKVIKEKNKVIDEAINYAKNTTVAEHGSEEIFNISELWFVKELLEILERGKK